MYIRNYNEIDYISLQHSSKSHNKLFLKVPLPVWMRSYNNEELYPAMKSCIQNYETQ